MLHEKRRAKQGGYYKNKRKLGDRANIPKIIH